MISRFYSIFAGLMALVSATAPLRATPTNPALAKAVVLENNVAYLRIGEVDSSLLDEIVSAQKALAATNVIAGTVLDLRLAGGNDPAAARSVADWFTAAKRPLAILVDGGTHGAAAVLASDLRAARAGLVFGAPTADLKPDIAVPVKTADEKKYIENPYAVLNPDETNAVANTNAYAPFIDHTSEADLVREKIKDGDEDEGTAPPRPVEPPKAYIHDPVLARAVDFIRALADFRRMRS